MAMRQRPKVLSTRMKEGQAAQVRALADLQGVSVCSLLREIVLPVVRERLVAEVTVSDDTPDFSGFLASAFEERVS